MDELLKALYELIRDKIYKLPIDKTEVIMSNRDPNCVLDDTHIQIKYNKLFICSIFVEREEIIVKIFHNTYRAFTNKIQTFKLNYIDDMINSCINLTIEFICNYIHDNLDSIIYDEDRYMYTSNYKHYMMHIRYNNMSKLQELKSYRDKNGLV
jgi:hypothetical protein